MMVSGGALAVLSTAQVFAASSSENSFSNLGFVFLASGFVFYGLIYFKYRNISKRHSHETETDATMHNVRGDDRLVKSLKGLSQPRMAAENGGVVNGVLRRFF
ncbi:hypothetical protein FM104_08290 [Microbacterium esteraromaticum]|uniref:Uncharacterized protein n=1 Tax=Microbacterium esteraromaticum TaxID=57043 RepID=A0A1R4JNN4_9MICO|nr:hypothetical protein [Microbacterium esteraromaticum]SJN33403.1 hypothetical protein FM104_08290 [Microbacterium esteraromaticum]